GQVGEVAESMQLQHAGGVPASQAVMAIHKDRQGAIKFSPALREFTQRNELGAWQVHERVFPVFADVQQLSAASGEPLPGCARRELPDGLHAQKGKCCGFQALTSGGTAVSNRLAIAQSSLPTRVRSCASMTGPAPMTTNSR